MSLPPQRREKVSAKLPHSTEDELRKLGDERQRSRAASRASKQAAHNAKLKEAAKTPDTAARSEFTLGELRPYLSKSDYRAAVGMRDSMIFISEVADRLGCTKYRVDMLDKSGELPHVRKKYIQVQKGVWARVWMPSDVDRFAAALSGPRD